MTDGGPSKPPPPMRTGALGLVLFRVLPCRSRHGLPNIRLRANPCFGIPDRLRSLRQARDAYARERQGLTSVKTVRRVFTICDTKFMRKIFPSGSLRFSRFSRFSYSLRTWIRSRVKTTSYTINDIAPVCRSPRRWPWGCLQQAGSCGVPLQTTHQ